MFIGAFCVSLKFLGVDTATLLASIGLMSFAISLGAKDIVADILAGLSLVFERTYYVGDIVQIGDFKGKVLEIGVRSTKLVSDTQDVKIISNHEIGSVINCSKQNSICVISISLPITTSIDELRKVLEAELPLVAQKNPHITKGPSFDGIQKFDGDKMTISISAEGLEEHMKDIRFDINLALQSMVKRGELEFDAKEGD
jgi:small conductance mechanosensitive channel